MGIWASALLPSVAGASGTFSPPHTDSGVDTDSDGRFNQLLVEVSVNVSEAGILLVEGFLQNANHSLLLVGSNEANLSAGFQTVQLRYPGSVINASGADGPYSVNLQLTDVETSTLLDSDIHTTAAYNHTDFEEPPIVLSPPHSDFGLDADANDRFDFLVVNVTVDVNEANTYVFQSVLHDPNGTLNAGAANTTALGLGPQTVKLQYSGPAIKEAGADGPYLVDMVIRNATTFALIDMGNHTTSPYDHLDFEGPSALLRPPHSEDAKDIDGDDLFDYLVLNVTVEVSDPGTYQVIGSISLDLNQTLTVENETSLEVGIQKLQMWFSGPVLRGGPDGPYHVSLLVWDPTNFTFLDNGVHTTAPYSNQDFDEARQLNSSPSSVPPTIDGSLSPGEWSGATLINLSSIVNNDLPGYLLVENDAAKAYVAYDVTGDLTEDLGDKASIGFDTNNDGLASPGKEDEFVQGGVNQTHYTYDATLKSWLIEDSPYDGGIPNHEGLESASGFGPSDMSQADHRIYEFSVPLSLLGIIDGGVVGFTGGSHLTPGIFDANASNGSNWPDFPSGMPLRGYGDLRLSDLTGPNLVIDAPGNNVFLGTDDITIEWTASDAASEVDRFEVALDLGTPVVLESFELSYTFAGVSEGSHSVTVTAFDSVENSRTATVNFSVDQSPPTLSGVSPADGSFLGSSNLGVTWTASDSGSGIDHFEVTLDDGLTQTLPSGTFNLTFDGVTDGSHLVNLTALDGVGHAKTALLHFTIDTLPPNISIISPAGNTVITSGEVEVAWQAGDSTSGIDHYQVTLLDGGTVTLPATTTKYTLSGVGNGPHSVTVRAFDRAGNQESQTTAFRVDTNPFSPTGPLGVLLLVAIPALIAGMAVLVIYLRRRGIGPN